MILGQSLMTIFRHSWVMVTLLIASIAALTLIVERLWYFSRNRFNSSKGLIELRRLLTSSTPADALNWAHSQKNPMGRLFTVALENDTLPGDELSDLLYSLILEERLRFERLVGGVGSLANVATLLGLLGTVTGLIRSFGNIAATGSGGPAVVSGGIAEALVATAFGLSIGIPTLFMYNYFTKKAGDVTIALESTSDRLIVMFARMRDRAGAEAPTAEPTAPRSGRPKPTTDDSSWRF
ncbi:MAG TPA: MotA/TolQ/ExbB proton channel family protein [bacterium]|nr:MotA/TolQ/ExbB proton channel family protein [bacterium]